MSGYARKLEVVPVSPDRFCPYCGRLLVKMHHERGTFDLAGKAQIRMGYEIDPENLPEDGLIDGFIEARCLYRRCRLREWWANRE
jgi:hypothetical protein